MADHARLDAMGVKVSPEITNHDDNAYFLGRDPDGNIFEVLQPAENKDRLSIAQASADEEGAKIVAERARIVAATAAAAN